MADLTDSVGEHATNRKADVALVQAMLAIVKSPKGHTYLSVFYDGQYGGKTKAAIEAFQDDYGTTVKASAAGAGGTRAADDDCVIRPGTMSRPAINLGTGSRPAINLGTGSRPAINLGTGLRPAITALQLNADTAGVVKPGGATIVKLNELLPRDDKDIMIAADTRVVYWPDLSTQMAGTAKAIEDDKSLHAEFRVNVAKLVRRMFEKHKILLTIAPAGGRRTFQKQYEIATTPDEDGNYATGAGPGESNHNWGQAVDIGFNKFEWVNTSDNSVTDDWWLNKLTKLHPGRYMEMWKIRNAIAFDELDMFPSKKPGDHIHIQRYSDDNVSMVKSLAALLEKKGKLSWRWNQSYECDLGYGGAWHKVGTATEIWDKSGPVDKHWIAIGKGVAVAEVKDSDVQAMRDALRADFEAAEAARDDWEPQPK
jgi:hypothetical protein